MNEHAIKILNKVKESIRKHPEGFNMDTWDCGTTACIAGWIVRRAHALFTGSAQAAQLLGLPYETTYGLWFTDCWPEDLSTAYSTARCATMKAEVACEAIDAFIKDPSQFHKRDGRCVSLLALRHIAYNHDSLPIRRGSGGLGGEFPQA